MRRFIAKRLGLSLVTLFLVSVIVFAISDVLPGDVGRSILGRSATDEQVAALDHQLGYDRPLPERYWKLVSGYATGDWGTSPVLNVEVRPLVLRRFGNSLILAAFAFALIVPFSIFMGIVAALHNGRWADRTISITGLSLIALPEFVTGVILLVVFAVQLGWFPSSSSVPTANPVDWFRQLLLPSIPLMCVLFGYIARMARAGTVDALRADYTRTATLKGLPRRTVVRLGAGQRHHGHRGDRPVHGGPVHAVEPRRRHPLRGAEPAGPAGLVTARHGSTVVPGRLRRERSR
jgi:peptide/nickel transport system permease protein